MGVLLASRESNKSESSGELSKETYRKVLSYYHCLFLLPIVYSAITSVVILNSIKNSTLLLTLSCLGFLVLLAWSRSYPEQASKRPYSIFGMLIGANTGLFVITLFYWFAIWQFEGAKVVGPDIGAGIIMLSMPLVMPVVTSVCGLLGLMIGFFWRVKPERVRHH